MDVELTFKDVVNVFKRRFTSFSITFALVVASTLIYLTTTQPIYEATAMLKIETSGGGISLTGITGLEGFPVIPQTSPGVSTEIELLKSRRILSEVVEKLNLLERLKSTHPELTLEDLLRTLSGWIDVSQVKNSNLVEITVGNPDPELAAEIANALIESYNDFTKETAKKQYSVKRSFIEEQILKVEKELKEIEDEIREFKEKNHFFVLEEEGKWLLQMISQYDERINDLTVQMEETKAGIETTKELLSKVEERIINSETITLNPIVTQLKSKLVSLNIELAGLLAVYPETNPKVMEVEKKIEETQKLLESEVERIVSSRVQVINPMYTRLVSQLTALEAKLKALKVVKASVEEIRGEYEDRVKTLPELEQRLLKLMRDLKLKENLYTLLVQKLEEVRISEAGITEKAQVIDTAIVPEKPVKPKKKFTLAIGGVVGIFLGLVVAFVRELTDPKIRDEIHVRWIDPDVRIIGRIPRYSRRIKPVVWESFKIVAFDLASCGLRRVGLAPLSGKELDVVEKLKKALEELGRDSDLVAVPPLNTAESRLVLEDLDCYAVLIRLGKTRKDALEYFLRNFKDEKFLGVVILGGKIPRFFKG